MVYTRGINEKFMGLSELTLIETPRLAFGLCVGVQGTVDMENEEIMCNV